MKMLRTTNILVFLLSVAALPMAAQTITAADAKNHIGQNATVCGTVTDERTATSSRGEPTFINLDSTYPNQSFTILIWEDDRKNIGELPRVGAHICASGVIKEYRGTPEIVVQSSGQLSY